MALPPGYIGDSGLKIEGARKDLRGNVNRDDIVRMTPEQRLKRVVKNTIWPTPDWVALVRDGGCTQKAALMIKMIRDSFPAAPIHHPTATEAAKLQSSLAYNTLVNAAKAVCEKGRTEQELSQSIQESPEAAQHLARLRRQTQPSVRPTYQCLPADDFAMSINEAFQGSRQTAGDILFALRCVCEGSLDRSSTAILRKNPAWPEHNTQADIWLRTKSVSAIAAGGGWVAAYHGRSSLDPHYCRYLDEMGFQGVAGKIYGIKQEAEVALRAVAETKYAEKLAVSKSKREQLIARAEGKPVGAPGPMLERIGRDWREGRQATGEDFIATFGVRGVQWGNYVPQRMRPELLNNGFDAMMDMADALNIPPSALSFGGMLGLAFGARGNGGDAAAHYEPLEKAINLTKASGAGCLAHELGHFFDHALGIKAHELGLVERTRDTGEHGFLSNLALKPAGDPAAQTPQERLLRELHGRFESIWLNSDPLTKADLVDQSERNRAKVLTNLMGTITRLEPLMQQPGTPPEERQRFEALAKQVRNPTPGDEATSYSQGVVGLVHIPTIQRTRTAHDLTMMIADTRIALASFQDKKALPDDHQETARPRRTEYDKACARIDADRSSPYYSKRAEEVARTVEAVVVDAMAEKEKHNYFLVDGAGGEAFPQGLEREKHNRTIRPLIARLPALMPEITVVPYLVTPSKPALPAQELASPAQMPLF